MNSDTLQSLLTVHREDIYRFLRFLGAEAADADDLVQETFIAAFLSRSQPQTEDPADWGRWLRGIARNMFLRLCRKNKNAYTSISLSELDRDEAFWDSEFSRDPGRALHIEALRECIQRLSERDRKVVYMKYRDNSSRKEIGNDIGLTENGVKSLLRTIRSKLGKCISLKLSGGKG